MCFINVSNHRIEFNAMQLKLGRLLVILLNLTLLSVVCVLLSEIYGVVIFRNGGYNEWTKFTKCTVSCGGGSMQRKRTCTNPVPSYGGYNCSRLGPAIELLTCKERGCPINGGFERWSIFNTCSKTCGGGLHKRVRYCIEPIPKFDGLDCTAQNLGPYEEERECNVMPCAIDGGYTAWAEWGQCSVTCGEGLMQRDRSCTNPTQQFGGEDCTGSGPEKETVSCSTISCAVHGRYGDWTGWDECTANCGGGYHKRIRACDSPPPSNGGMSCREMGQGNEEDLKPCNTQPCDQDGGYGDWSEWTDCTKTCGEGRTERKRYCNNPKPIGKGQTCKHKGLGASIEADECYLQDC